jgi:endonuclease/exonuclease/phosphatase family metal-dependent hydrolase
MSEGTLVVLTQNAWGGAAGWAVRKPTLARAIDLLKPDVVGLQEVHASATSGDGASQAHELAALLPGYRAHFAAGKQSPDGTREGVALLTRGAVHATSFEKLTLDRADPWDGESQRVVLHARVDGVTLDRPLDLFVTHLSLSRQARGRTVAELLDFVERTRSRDAVLMGDLNATPDEEIITRLGERWIDAWGSRHPGRRGGTWPAIAPFKRLDYVFVPREGELVVRTCHRLPYAGSDHLGLVAHLRRRPME